MASTAIGALVGTGVGSGLDSNNKLKETTKGYEKKLQMKKSPVSSRKYGRGRG